MTLPSDLQGSIQAAFSDVLPDRLLEHLVSTLPDGLFAIDAEGAITFWNQAMESITGFAAEEALGQPCSILEGDTCVSESACNGGLSCSLFHTGEVLGRRCTVVRSDGRRVSVLKNARVLRDDAGQVIGGIETVTDLSTVESLERQIAQLRDSTEPCHERYGLIGGHPSMERLRDLIALAGRSPSSVLVLGETGTGKELVARAIHAASARAEGPFVRVSCAALSPGLLESELFGHVRGAFTGAVGSRIGRFEAADGGTLFLDEIGDISLETQTKLLRVLQEREFERVGSSRPVKVDIRVVAATNQDLATLCEEGRFRTDLYYRLAVIPLEIPPLRVRRSDIPLLIDHFVRRFNEGQGRAIAGVTPPALATMVAHEWPGNVRELEHAIEYAFVVARDDVIDQTCLPVGIGGPAGTPPSARRRKMRAGGPAIILALEQANGNREAAAAALGVSRMTLYKWMKALDIRWKGGPDRRPEAP